MSYIKDNPNPCCIIAPDCVVRAINIATGESWHRVYADICLQGAIMCNMPSVNAVWGTYLRKCGYPEHDAPEGCTVRSFAASHRGGVYILATGTHAVAVISGNYLDAWDSGSERVRYYFTLEE